MKKSALLTIGLVLFMVGIFTSVPVGLSQEMISPAPASTPFGVMTDSIDTESGPREIWAEDGSASLTLESVAPLQPSLNDLFLPLSLNHANDKPDSGSSLGSESLEMGEMILGESLIANESDKEPGSIEPEAEPDREPPAPGLELYPAESDEKFKPADAAEPDGVDSGVEDAPLGVDAGWSTIMTEGFEGTFPQGSWRAIDNNGTSYGQYFWDDDDYKPYTGKWSGWAANGGANGLDPQYYNYPNNMNSWIVYGPFDLRNTSRANLSFYFWNQSEQNYDYFGWYASANGTNFHGSRVSGNSNGWRFVNFDLTAVPGLGNLTGDSSVWIAFIATSDSSVTNKGAFVDNITLQKYTNTISCPNQYKAEYFNGRTLSGNPVFVRCEGWPISRNWGNGGPGNGVGNDNFSVRWTGTANINAGTYTFVATADDGIRVWLDGTLIINAWRDQAPTEYRATRTIGGGNHAIKVEYYENGGGAVAQFRWETASMYATGARTADNNGTTKTTFRAGEAMRYYGSLYNGTGQSSTAYQVFSRRGPCGTTTMVSGNFYLPPGNLNIYHPAPAPQNCPGTYTYTYSITYNGRTTSKSSTFVVTSGNESQGIEYRTRDGFHVFKIDMFNPNLTFETVMAKDANSGQTTDAEFVREMVGRSPYSSRNPILAVNADYFGPGHHGAEGLTVKNGKRLPNAGSHVGIEWKRSSLSISNTKVLRMGRQTDCQGPPDNKCASWVPNSNAYYNTLGGGPLFVQDGVRIGGRASLQPCTNEGLTTSYCTGSFKWTAAGISRDGRYLIIVVSDTTKTMDDAAAVLIAEGAWRAMKFDGGGSTQVWYKPKGSLIGGDRRVANALVVFSRP